VGGTLFSGGNENNFDKFKYFYDIPEGWTADTVNKVRVSFPSHFSVDQQTCVAMMIHKRFLKTHVRKPRTLQTEKSTNGTDSRWSNPKVRKPSIMPQGA
jgi:hypothetical protein